MASTIRDVAARAGLSVGTVSKYINGKTVKESTRLAIEEAIKELDFHPKNKYLYLSLNGKNNYVKQTGSYLFLLFRFWSWQFIIHRIKKPGQKLFIIDIVYQQHFFCSIIR